MTQEQPSKEEFAAQASSGLALWLQESTGETYRYAALYNDLFNQGAAEYQGNDIEGRNLAGVAYIEDFEARMAIWGGAEFRQMQIAAIRGINTSSNEQPMGLVDKLKHRGDMPDLKPEQRALVKKHYSSAQGIEAMGHADIFNERMNRRSFGEALLGMAGTGCVAFGAYKGYCFIKNILFQKDPNLASVYLDGGMTGVSIAAGIGLIHMAMHDTDKADRIAANVKAAPHITKLHTDLAGIADGLARSQKPLLERIATMANRDRNR